MIETRMYAGIPSSNEYLFARPGGTALDGCKAMRDITSKCPGLESPQLIRTRLLRKYLATTIQLLDMTGEELKMVADHMGHSVSVHTNVYRLQTSVLEKTKVARALIALENGQLSKFPGKNLSACSVDELPVPIVEIEERDNLDIPVIDRESEGESENESCKQRKRAYPETSDETMSLKLKNKKRKRWTPEEEKLIMSEFSSHISNKQNPTSGEIKTAQNKHSLLKERPVPVIRSKINNIILGKCKGKI